MEDVHFDLGVGYGVTLLLVLGEYLGGYDMNDF